MSTTTPTPCFAAPAARGWTAYYRRETGKGFVQNVAPSIAPRLGQTFTARGETFIVEGFCSAVEGIRFSHDVVDVDGLPVAVYGAPIVAQREAA